MCAAEGNNPDTGFDEYYIPDALDPEAPTNAEVFLNGSSSPSL